MRSTHLRNGGKLQSAMQTALQLAHGDLDLSAIKAAAACCSVLVISQISYNCVLFAPVITCNVFYMFSSEHIRNVWEDNTGNYVSPSAATISRSHCKIDILNMFARRWFWKNEGGFRGYHLSLCARLSFFFLRFNVQCPLSSVHGFGEVMIPASKGKKYF